MVIEVFVTLGESKDALLELALLSVDDFVGVAVVFEELRCAREKIEFSVNFSQKKQSSI